ncbi:hypothetical protein MHM95_09915 [Pseudoalteromonas sp. CnMc7-15]|uniref:hypothetical protein n=1 Tax=unclassified Pseudoalteromonas TaxID=194690 RepID=UPI001EF59848|nr:hypothetical protein [Pseudoalteromonas sp. CnMc7-15]MCG7566606.1 hypothetical protein [Pseudoalteromonas sp. CnMc7-15]
MMRNVHTTINDYYKTFESYRGVFSYKSWLTWFVMISMLLSCFSIFWFVGITNPEAYFGFPDASKSVRMIVFLAIAAITTFSWFKVTFKKDSLTRQRAQSILDTEEDKLWKLEKMWLHKHLPHNQFEYLELAEKIESSVSLREKYRGFSSFSAKDILEHIFSNESKPRVLAMFLMLCAGIVTLSIKGGASLETVFEFYGKASWKELIMIFLFVPVMVYVAYLEIKFVVIVLARGLERLFERYDGQSAYSRRKTKIFINALVRYFAFEKPRIRVKNDFR